MTYEYFSFEPWFRYAYRIAHKISSQCKNARGNLLDELTITKRNDSIGQFTEFIKNEAYLVQDEDNGSENSEVDLQERDVANQE